MSMHILPAYYTTTVSSRKKKSKKSTTISQHEIWLINKGLHPTQIAKKKTVDKTWKQNYNNDMMVDRSTRHYDKKQFTAGDCSKKDIMSNLHKEPKHVQEAILEKSKRTAPLYSKGPYQLITEGSSLKEIGKKL
jgi:hypothetical protein